MAIDTALDRRPTAEAVKVEDLLDMVRRGEVRVPPFQRDLKWRAQHVKALFDSLLRGYPVGTLLFWRRAAEAGEVRLGPLRIHAGPERKARWVIDGQQRITSLAAVLLREDEEGNDPFALWFDLETDELKSREDGPRGPGWLPLRVLGDLERLLDWMRSERSEDRRKTAQRLAKSIREYQIPTYTVETDDEQIARDIFNRMNNSGEPLQAEDVFNALHGGAGPEPGDLRDLARRLSGERFGTWEQRWLLKAVAAVAGKDLSRGLEEIARTHRDLGEALPRAEQALLRVIHFLRQDAEIPHLRLLPYRLPILVLTRFFDRFPEPRPRTRTLLARWLWRGAVSGVHADNSAPLLRDTVDAVAGSEHEAATALLSELSSRTDPSDFASRDQAKWLLAESWNAKAATSRIAAQALVALRPRHLLTGRLLDVASVLDMHGPDAFPSLLREGATGPVERILHPPLPDLRRILVDLQDADVLASHGFAREEAPLLAPQSLNARERRMRRALSGFLYRQLGLGDTDRPALEALRVGDEEDAP